jgi:hypothetical protein
MRANYDFSQGVRAKYYRRFQQGTNLALIEADLAKYFPDSEAVNNALRSIVNAVSRKPRSRRSTARPARRAR